MQLLFIDTSAFYAIADSSDQRHQAASSFSDYAVGKYRFVTTNYILDELQPFAYLRRTITAVGKIIAEMNRRDQIFNSHSQQSLYYNLRLRHKTADKSF